MIGFPFPNFWETNLHFSNLKGVYCIAWLSSYTSYWLSGYQHPAGRLLLNNWSGTALQLRISNTAVTLWLLGHVVRGSMREKRLAGSVCKRSEAHFKGTKRSVARFKEQGPVRERTHPYNNHPQNENGCPSNSEQSALKQAMRAFLYLFFISKHYCTWYNFMYTITIIRGEIK